MNTLGSRIKTLRLERNMSQKELSEICHVARSTIAQYELDKIQPSQEVRVILCNLFNVSSDYLAGFSQLRSNKVLMLSNEEYIQVPLIDLNTSNTLKHLVLSKNKFADKNLMFIKSPSSFSQYRINNNDLLLVQKQAFAHYGDIVLFKYNNTFFIGRFLDQNKFIFYNDTFKNGFLTLDKKTVEIIGIILEVSFKINTI